MAINGFERVGAAAESSRRLVRVSHRRRHGDLVYATDHEFGNPDIDLALAHFSRGARALILDSHFTPDEMPAHKGWGHSDWSQCARFAADCGAQQLWLFHHKPGRPDDEMAEIERAAQEVFENTHAAKEGDVSEKV